MGDRIVVMLDGVIQQVAPPLELYRQPVNSFVATFIGSPPMNLIAGALERTAAGLRFVGAEGGPSIAVPEGWAARLDHLAGRPVTLGVRPEDLTASGEDTPPEQTLEARVEVIEPMGAETYLYLRAGANALTARVHPQSDPRVGQPFTLHVHGANLHFFDPGTGASLR